MPQISAKQDGEGVKVVVRGPTTETLKRLLDLAAAVDEIELAMRYQRYLSHENYARPFRILSPLYSCLRPYWI